MSTHWALTGSGDNLVTHEYFREELPQLLGLSEVTSFSCTRTDWKHRLSIWT